MNFSHLANKLRCKITKFSGIVSKGLDKTARRFIQEAIYGIICISVSNADRDWKATGKPCIIKENRREIQQAIIKAWYLELLTEKHLIACKRENKRKDLINT